MRSGGFRAPAPARGTSLGAAPTRPGGAAATGFFMKGEAVAGALALADGVGVALAMRGVGFRRTQCRLGVSDDFPHSPDFVCQDAELSDEVSRGEVAEKGFVALGVVVGALDEDGSEDARGDFRRSVGPDAGGARGERYRVRLYVAEDQDFVAAFLVADEEGGAVIHADVLAKGVARFVVAKASAAEAPG